MTTSHHPKPVERRRDVRVRPAADYEVKAELQAGDVTSPLQVLDISLGGLGVLVSHALGGQGVGEEVTVRMSVRGAEPFLVRASIRHVGPPGFGVCGLQFQDLTELAKTAIRRCVSELLERGQHF